MSAEYRPALFWIRVWPRKIDFMEEIEEDGIE